MKKTLETQIDTLDNSEEAAKNLEPATEHNFSNEASINSRAELEANLHPEKLAVLDEIGKLMGVQINDQHYHDATKIKYELQRTYERDEEGKFILTEEEDALLNKYNYSVDHTSSEEVLNDLIVDTKNFDNLPLEMKDEITQSLKSLIDQSYCNPEDEKNQPQSQELSITDKAISIGLGVIFTPVAGLLFGASKSAYNNQNKCSSTMEVVANTLIGGAKGVAYGSAPVVTSIIANKAEDLINEQIEKNKQEKQLQREEDIASGKVIMTKEETLHKLSNSVINLRKVVERDMFEHEQKIKDEAYQKEMAEIDRKFNESLNSPQTSGTDTVLKTEAKSETEHTSLQKVSANPSNNDPYVQPLGNLNLGYQNISLDKINYLQADFEKSQTQENKKRNTFSI